MADIPAQPYSFSFDPARAGLLIIDMQRDFLEPSGFGAALGNDVGRLRAAIDPTRILLQAARNFGLCVIHTREGHLPDLSDLPGTKHRRGRFATRIGDAGPMGRLLVRGEAGNAIIPELAPLAGETVIDKPGKGAFYATDLEGVLHRNRISQLLICGVTTEVCVASTVREANDRGFDCLVLQDCTASYFPEFHEQTLRMMTAQDGIFGWVAESLDILRVIDRRGDFLSAPSVTPAGTGG